MKQSENPIANPLVVLREEFDDWAVLFNPENAEAVGINPVGVVLWKLMDGQHSPEQLTQKMADHFSDIPETASDDVSSFIDDLSGRGFIGYELQKTE